MIKYISLFSGIGAPEKALEKLNIPYELLGFSEIDKFAIKSYCKVHNVDESLNLGDITKIDINTLPTDIDLITHGSPCQDFSVAGKGLGGDKGSNTRSSLMWNTVDIVKHCKPKYILWENVKNLLSKKHRHNFDAYIETMSNLGYNNYYKVLNAKDFGIPQNRERVFTISIRKDIDKGFEFPKPIELKLTLKDLLETKVDEKFYLKDEIVDRFVLKDSTLTKNIIGTTKPKSRTIGQRDLVYNPNAIIGTLTSTDYKQPKQILQIGTLDIKGNEQIRRVYGSDGLSPTLSTMQEGNTQPKILDFPCIAASRGRNPLNPSDRTPGTYVEQRLEPNTKGLCNTLTSVQKDNYVLVKETTKTGYKKAYPGDSINLEQPNSKTRRGRVEDKIANTLTTSCNIGVIDGIKIRKLTPRECWRLMGFEDEDFNKAAEINSNTQLYKQAGNSIVVNVLVEIFKQLFKEMN